MSKTYQYSYFKQRHKDTMIGNRQCGIIIGCFIGLFGSKYSISTVRKRPRRAVSSRRHLPRVNRTVTACHRGRRRLRPRCVRAAAAARQITYVEIDSAEAAHRPRTAPAPPPHRGRAATGVPTGRPRTPDRPCPRPESDALKSRQCGNY